MGEEEKKSEEKKVEAEEKKPEEEKKEKKEEEKSEKLSEEKKDDKKAEDSKEAPPPPPPEEIVLRVYMHCEGCARKVKRCLKGFEGVEDVQADCKTHKVIVKGKKADPLKILERVQRKSHNRQVVLLTPIPKPPVEDAKKIEENKDNVKPEEKKEEPQVIVVVLKVHMHCEGCAQEIKKRIQRMKGVEAADPDLKSSQVIVKGVFDPAKLVEYVYKRTGKHAVIVKQEPGKKEEDKGKEEKKAEEAKPAADKEKKEKEGEEAKAEVAAGEEEAAKVVELKKNEFYCYPYPSRYAPEQVYAPQVYAPQFFSDENPNACSVM